VYTRIEPGVYLRNRAVFRLCGPDEEIELARKIADLLVLEELGEPVRQGTDGPLPDVKEWAVILVDMTWLEVPSPADLLAGRPREDGQSNFAPGGVDRQEVHDRAAFLQGTSFKKEACLIRGRRRNSTRKKAISSPLMPLR